MTTPVDPGARRVRGAVRARLGDVMVLLVVVALLTWFAVSLPLAMAVGRAFRSGAGGDPRRRRVYDLAA